MSNKQTVPVAIVITIVVMFAVIFSMIVSAVVVNYRKREGKIVDTFHREGKDILIYKNGAVSTQHIPDEYYLTVQDFDGHDSHTTVVTKEVYEQAVKNKLLIDK